MNDTKRHNIKVAAKASAKRRTCRECGRRGALGALIRGPEALIRVCRYCDAERIVMVYES